MSDSAIKPLRAEFLTSAPHLRHCPDDNLPEVAFAGRSNAGKSSVLNRLTGTRDLARTSKTPGRTQAINFFRVALEGGNLVDLPGYGYAKTPKAMQAMWQKEIEAYLAKRQQLVGVVLIMDIRHPFKDFDQQLLAWASAAELPMHVLLNKADKLNRGPQQQTLAAARRQLPLPDLQGVQTFSALKGTGVAEALEVVRGWIRTGQPPAAEDT